MVFFFQAEDGIRDLVRSRGLGDVYKRQPIASAASNCQRSSWASSLRNSIDEAETPVVAVMALSLIHI